MKFLPVKRDDEIRIYSTKVVGRSTVVESFALGDKDTSLAKALTTINKI